MPAWLLPTIIAGASLLGAGKGKAPSYGSQPRLTPQQQSLMNLLLDQLKPKTQQVLGDSNYDMSGSAPFLQGYGALQNQLQPYDPGLARDAFDRNIGDKTINDFNQRIVPSVQQSFIQNGGARSSAYNAGIANQGVQLSDRLAGQRAAALLQAENLYGNRQLQASGAALNYARSPADHQINQQNALANLLGTGLNTNTQQMTYNPGRQSAAPGLLGAAGALYGYGQGGPQALDMARLYGGLGSAVGGLF